MGIHLVEGGRGGEGRGGEGRGGEGRGGKGRGGEGRVEGREGVGEGEGDCLTTVCHQFLLTLFASQHCEISIQHNTHIHMDTHTQSSLASFPGCPHQSVLQ